MNHAPLKIGLFIGVVLIGVATFLLTRPSLGSMSKSGYQITVALESTCSRKDTNRLKKIREMLEEKSEITDDERHWLDEILTQAESGRWEEARRMSRDLMLAQVDR